MEIFEKPTDSNLNPKVVPEFGACPSCSSRRLMAQRWNRRPPHDQIALKDTGLTGEVMDGFPVERAVNILDDGVDWGQLR